jgi:WD40 repeat protein
MIVVPYALQNAKTLSSKSMIIAAGTVSNNSTHVEVLDMTSKGKVITSISAIGKCCGMEICGIPRHSRTFVAFTTTISGNGSLHVYELHNLIDDISIRENNEFSSISLDNTSFTSLAFNANTCHLAASTEMGDIIIRDLSTGNEINNFTANFCGINAIKYSRTGHLVSISDSSQGHVQLWDARSDKSTLLSSYNYPVREYPLSLTSLCLHPSNDFDIFCGTSIGSIIQFDSRRDGVVDEYVMHPQGGIGKLCSTDSCALCTYIYAYMISV